MYYVEKYWPICLALILSIFFFLFEKRIQNIEDAIKKIMDASLAICGTLLGFLLTILTIINSIETRRMQFVRDSGTYPTLIRYLKTALTSNIITISMYFLTPFLLSFDGILKHTEYVYAVSILIISFSWFANIRFASIFIKLLSDPHKEELS